MIGALLLMKAYGRCLVGDAGQSRGHDRRVAEDCVVDRLDWALAPSPSSYVSRLANHPTQVWYNNTDRVNFGLHVNR